MLPCTLWRVICIPNLSVLADANILSLSLSLSLPINFHLHFSQSYYISLNSFCLRSHNNPVLCPLLLVVSIPKMCVKWLASGSKDIKHWNKNLYVMFVLITLCWISIWRKCFLFFLFFFWFNILFHFSFLLAFFRVFGCISLMLPRLLKLSGPFE